MLASLATDVLQLDVPPKKGFSMDFESKDVFCNTTFQGSCSAVSHKHHIVLGHDMATRC